MPRTWTIRASSIAALCTLSGGYACAAAFPERPITIIVSFAAGGASDVAARILSRPLGRLLGQQVIVEDRGGASGMIATGAVARAKPDGYTLLLTTSVYVVNPSLYKMPYDPYKDLQPVIEIGVAPNVIVTYPGSNINSVADLVALAKANPQLISYGSPGTGTTPQLAAEVLKLRTRINMVHVPYSGAAPALQAVIGKHVQVMTASLSSVMPQLKTGQIKGLVQTGSERWPDLPDVPTMAEAGIPDAVSETFQALFAPGATPREIVDRLAKECTASLNEKDTQDLLWQAGLAVTGKGPDAMRARIAEEIPLWKEVVDKAGIKPE